MNKSSAVLELRLIKEKLAQRLAVANDLSRSAWVAKRMELPPGERFLVVSPHPDDDAIGCGGTMLKLLAAGKRVRICYLSLPMVGVTDREERRSEAMSALQVLKGVEYSLRDQEFPSSQKEVAAAIRQQVQDFRPDCVMIPSPMENHEQHLMSLQALVPALDAASPVPSIMLYEVWGPLVPNLVVDVTAEMERKLQAIRAHASQVRMVDYCAMISGLNQYRAHANGLKGYAEAFLYLEAKDLMEMLR